MEITIDRKRLVSSLVHVARASDAKSSIPAFAYVSLHVLAGGVYLSATDGRLVHRSGRIEGDPSRYACSGTLALDAKRLLSTVRSMDGDTVTIVGERDACVRSGSTSVELPGLAADDLPRTDATIADASADPVYSLSTAKLREALSVIYCASEDDTRPHLAAVLLEIEEGQARGVATDGHRLAMRGPKGKISITIPREAGEAWGAMLKGNADDTAHVFVGKSRAGLFFGGAWSITPLRDERFPPYAKVIPTGNPITIRLDGKTATAALKRAAIAVKGAKNNGVLLTAADGTLRIATASSVETIELGEGSFPMTEVHGFNVEYLLDAVKNAGRSIVCAFAGVLDPLVVTGDDSTHVVMPMRV